MLPPPLLETEYSEDDPIDLTEVANRFQLYPYKFEPYESFMLRLTRAMVWVGMDDDPTVMGLITELPVLILVRGYLSVQ